MSDKPVLKKTLLHILNGVSRAKRAANSNNLVVPSLGFYNEESKSFHDKTITIGLAEWEQKQLSEWQSLLTKEELLQNHMQALVIGNSLATVSIGNKKFTISECIALRKHLGMVHTRMVQAVRVAMSLASNTSRRLEEELQTVRARLQAAHFGQAKTLDPKNTAELDAMVEKQRYVLKDPINLEKEVEKFTKEYEQFDQEIDAALQIANSTLEVKVDERGFVDLGELRQRLAEEMSK